MPPQAGEAFLAENGSIRTQEGVLEGTTFGSNRTDVEHLTTSFNVGVISVKFAFTCESRFRDLEENWVVQFRFASDRLTEVPEEDFLLRFGKDGLHVGSPRGRRGRSSCGGSGGGREFHSSALVVARSEIKWVFRGRIIVAGGSHGLNHGSLGSSWWKIIQRRQSGRSNSNNYWPCSGCSGSTGGGRRTGSGSASGGGGTSSGVRSRSYWARGSPNGNSRSRSTVGAERTTVGTHTVGIYLTRTQSDRGPACRGSRGSSGDGYDRWEIIQR